MYAGCRFGDNGRAPQPSQTRTHKRRARGGLIEHAGLLPGVCTAVARGGRGSALSAPSWPLLAALFAPCAAHEFRDRHWPGVPLAVHGPRARLPLPFNDDALASAPALAQRYRGRLRFTHGGSERMVRADGTDAQSLLDMGLTVQFVDVVQVLPQGPAFLRALEAELGLHEGATTMCAFASAPDDGLNRHFDAAELISVQLTGTKQFHYAPVPEMPVPTGGQYAPRAAPVDELYPQATHGFPDPARVTFATAAMAPGSVLFLPRGTWHYTQAGAPSLSISIVVDPPAALRCLLDQLRLLLLQDPAWRMPLIGGYGDRPQDARVRVHAAALLAGLPAVIARLTAEDLLSAPASVDWRLAHMTPATRFQRAPHTRFEIGPAGPHGGVAVRFFAGHGPALAQPTGEVEVSPGTLPILRWLDARCDGPFTAAQVATAFAGEPLPALQQVLGLCVQTQLLRVLWYAPLLDPH